MLGAPAIAQAGGDAHTRLAAGRSLDHHMMATHYTVLINAGNGRRLSDGAEQPTAPHRRNDFTYAGDDNGLRCPLGAHLRRSNPRLTPLKRATAVRRHRLIRRGVEYGPHLADGALEDDGVDRGLVNLFVQADIERQFEFVQNEWMKGGEFVGLDASEQDPINGVGGEGSQMFVPGAKRPILFDLPTFVHVKGGEYLFVPGLNASTG